MIDVLTSDFHRWSRCDADIWQHGSINKHCMHEPQTWYQVEGQLMLNALAGMHLLVADCPILSIP